MEKKKMKMWKKVVIFLLLLLLIFIGFTTRKVIILSNIDTKVTDYENNNKNIYIKTIFDFNDYTSKIERFIKDDVDKMVLEKTSKDGEVTKMIQITYPMQRKFFTEANGQKVLSVFEEKAAIRGSHLELDATTDLSYNVIQNFAYSISLPERIMNAIFTSIRTVEMDGKECYELSSLSNSNFLYEEGATKLLTYVEKESGLPVKVIQEMKKDNEVITNTTTYQYSFGTVTDEDMQEPNVAEYRISQ